MKRVAIVGAGLSGLATAFALRDRGVELVVLESDNRVGGKIRTEITQGLLCEWGPTSFHEGEPAMTSLIQDLGLTSRLIRAVPPSAPSEATGASRSRVQTFAELMAPPEGSPEVSFLEGMEELTAALHQRLSSATRLSTKVLQIESRDGHFSFAIEASSGRESIQADVLVLATPSYVSANLVRGLTSQAADALASIPWEPITVLHAAFKAEKPLDRYGLLVSKDNPDRMPGGLLRVSSAPIHPHGPTLVVHARFGAAEGLASASEAELFKRIRLETGPLLEDVGVPFFQRVVRHERALPVYDADHPHRLEILDDAERAQPGLFFVGNAYRGRKTPDCVREAHAAAARILRLSLA